MRRLVAVRHVDRLAAEPPLDVGEVVGEASRSVRRSRPRGRARAGSPPAAGRPGAAPRCRAARTPRSRRTSLLPATCRCRASAWPPRPAGGRWTVPTRGPSPGSSTTTTPSAPRGSGRTRRTSSRPSAAPRAGSGRTGACRPSGGVTPGALLRASGQQRSNATPTDTPPVLGTCTKSARWASEMSTGARLAHAPVTGPACVSPATARTPGAG